MAVAESAVAESAQRLVTDRNGLEVLDEPTCRALLARSPIGRIAYLGAGMARVVPVNIVVRDREVFFRVGTGALLGAIADGQLLTLEVDDIDPECCCGWSVVVTGSAREAARAYGHSLPAVTSWVRPDTARLVRLTVLEISGRRLANKL